MHNWQSCLAKAPARRTATHQQRCHPPTNRSWQSQIPSCNQVSSTALRLIPCLCQISVWIVKCACSWALHRFSMSRSPMMCKLGRESGRAKRAARAGSRGGNPAKTTTNISGGTCTPPSIRDGIGGCGSRQRTAASHGGRRRSHRLEPGQIAAKSALCAAATGSTPQSARHSQR